MDIIVRNEGTIFIFTPRTDRAREWIDKNVNTWGPVQWYGGSLVVEHRYALDLAEGMERDGLVVL